MIKGKLDFKLINIVLIAIVCYIFYKSSDLWLNIFNKLISILLPLFLGFSLAYVIYPFINYLKRYKIPKVFGIFIVLFLIILILGIIMLLLIPILSNQLISLIMSVINFIQNLEDEFLYKMILQIVSNINFFSTINFSIDLISKFIITIFSSVYFLLDMDKIRKFIKNNVKEKTCKFLKDLDIQMNKYISGFFKIVLISFFEYTIIYYIICHPNSLFLGFLSALSNFIPYFGALIVQGIAIMTGFAVSQRLGIIVIIISLILNLFDSYILNSYVYGKSNQLHPIVIIISVIASSSLLGIYGVIFAIPIAIFVVNAIKFYKK